MTTKAEALVIGGGPVGLFAALCLLERGVAVQVLDAAGERPVRGYACGLHAETLRLFDGAGVLPAVLDAGHRIDQLEVRLGKAPLGRVELSEVPGGYPFVLMLRQSELEDLLTAALAGRGSMVARHHCVDQVHVRDGSVRVTGSFQPPPQASSRPRSPEPFVRESDFVIGADGHFSACRRALGVDLMTLQPTRAFAVCEFLADLRGWEGRAQLVLSEDSLSAFWPLGPNLGRWTFQVWERLDEPPSLELLQTLLRERAPWFGPKPEQLCWGAVAPFEQQLVRRFGSGRVWLAGDAAHAASPIGFQSMNRGFSEGRALAGIIAGALYDGQHRYDRFERYEREQSSEWCRLLGTAGGEQSASPVQRQLVTSLPATGPDLDAMLAQLR
jgi:2-polyprenyl-6-methoxyphenol hydroxylase-like FAD-dependent oxidoreductase